MLLQYSFEGGTSGNSIAVGDPLGPGDTPFDAIGGTAPKYSTLHPAHGSLGLSFQGVGGPEWTSTSVGTPTTVWGRCYVALASTPLSGNASVVRGFTPTNATSEQFLVRVNTGLTVSTKAKAGTIKTSATTLSTNTIYRLEYKFFATNSGSCTVDCVIYAGDSTTPLETMAQATAAGTANDTSVNQIWFNSVNNITPVDTVFIDDVQANDSGFPGPLVTIPPIIQPQLVLNQSLGRARLF